MRIRPLPILAAISLAAAAQQAPKKQPTTTVTGHVYLADTNTPARLATVMLEPARVLDNDPDPHPPKDRSAAMVYTSAVQTLLDGSFTIPKVAPGAYYVVAYKSGYLSPLSTLSEDALKHPTPEDHKRIAGILPRIVVEAGLPASVEVRLERGSAISGTVLFDDGSPASGLPVHALVRRKDGQKETWSPLRPMPFALMADVYTDDLGRYRLTGLQSREYMVEVVLQLQQMNFASAPGESGGSSSINNVASLSFYSGSATRKADAKPFKLSANEENSGEDITIPLAKLHTITGEIVAAHDGHVLNQGNVKLLDAGDKSEVETGKLERADGKFHLLFVPEGNYILRVDTAADVTYEDVPYPPGTMPATHEVTHAIHTYGDADQPINIHDDAPTVVVSVPEKGAATTPKQAAASQ
ncbi:MAG: carboxypeptidase regulatory-like domain-containing protein [Acidobacteriaceae bacterium]